MDTDNIVERIRIARSRGLLSNCYSMTLVSNYRRIWSSENGFILECEDHGVNRLFFFVDDWECLDNLLQNIEEPGKYYFELMTNEYGERKIKGARGIAHMQRVSNPDCRSVLALGSSVLKYKEAYSVECASESDAEEINKMLWATFHTEISHLLTTDELRDRISKGQCTIHRNPDNKIDALLQAEVLPKKFYINQIINMGEKGCIHSILLSRMEHYIDRGGRYLYAWVDADNVASLKFHEKYGMHHDGVWNIVYCFER